MINHHLAILVGLFLVAVVAVQGQSADGEDAKLTAFFKQYLEEEFRQRPLLATQLGDHRFDDRLDDLSPEARKGGVERQRKALADLAKTVNHQKLTRSGQIDFEILKHHLTREIWLAENTRPFEDDPRVYNEYISDSVWLLLTQSTQPKVTNVKNAAARIGYVPKIVAAAKASLKNPPAVILETAIRQNGGSIGFLETGIFELAGENAQLGELGPACKAAVPVLKEYQKFLETLLPKAKGEWRLGKEKFYKKMELELDAGLTADEVLREAEAEFDRVEKEMYVIARQLWSTTAGFREKAGVAPLPPDDPAGRCETIRKVLAYLGREHGKPDGLVQDARDSVAAIKKFITANDILRLPDPDRCQVIEMPEFQRGNSTAYLNPAPPLDPKASSFYAISPPPKDWDARKVASYLEEYNRYMLQLLTIHEAYPGHYVQLEYSNRHPSLVRKILSSGVFAEGWAVYTEQMMLDQGYGKADPALRLHQLKWYLRAVTNTILDHKMHCAGMTDEEAMKLLVEGAYQTEGEALKKVIRAKQSSCQLSTYFVGRTAFYRLRQQVERELGEKFDLGRFHEACLDHGTLPVKYLPEVVRERLKKRAVIGWNINKEPTMIQSLKPRLPTLENGDRLSRDEFERRYEAMPHLKKAELIEGVVHMPSPVRQTDHSGPHFRFNGWLALYEAQTPGVEGGDNGSLRLDLDNEPQPDGFLRYVVGGRSRIDDDGYVVGSPELTGEIAASSVSIDLGPKLNVYRRNGVQEYVVWRVLDEAIDWFVLRGSQYDRLPLSAEGWFKSEVFPGLWLDPAAMIRGDRAEVFRVAQLGVASPEHAVFVSRLRQP